MWITFVPVVSLKESFAQFVRVIHKIRGFIHHRQILDEEKSPEGYPQDVDNVDKLSTNHVDKWCMPIH
jgi:hypothetical protein